MIAPDHYNARQGTTDSEMIFLLLMSDGLTDDPMGAFARTVGRIESIMRDNRIETPLRLTAAATDGCSILAVRYASDDKAPTLYSGPSCIDGQARPSGPAVIV
ncbi:MAG: class II glutamine amidotransferase, partial [Pseudomonadota bacterium]|nr:class II glutamine amidotransferase [Pseudomonadota bacterium]